MIAGLLSGQRRDGGFGVHPYSKWLGSRWRLVSLTQLGVPRASPAARAAADDALELLRSRRRPDGMWRVGGHKYWRKRGASNLEAVDWGDGHQVVAPIALGILG